MIMHIAKILLATLPIIPAAMAPAKASGIDALKIVGVWSDPILAGYGIDGATRALTYKDHSSDAVYSIYNAPLTGGSSTIRFGKAVSGGVTNKLSFTGGIIPSNHDSEPFDLGSISYRNGDVTRTIFGATLTLYATDGGTLDIPLGSTQVAFNQTDNDGTRSQDADYLTFGGLNGSFEAYEDRTVSGSLEGTIVGDPTFVLTGLSLAEGQMDNGFIGHDPSVAISGVPLPSAMPMFAAALGLIGFCSSLRRRKDPRRSESSEIAG